jgi:hypothetical protein
MLTSKSPSLASVTARVHSPHRAFNMKEGPEHSRVDRALSLPTFSFKLGCGICWAQVSADAKDQGKKQMVWLYLFGRRTAQNANAHLSVNGHVPANKLAPTRSITACTW